MLLQIFSFILHLPVSLVVFACLLRAYTHLLGINFALKNSATFAVIVFALSNWIVLPIRRVIAPTARLDLASVVAAYLVVVAEHALLWLIAGDTAASWHFFAQAGLSLIGLALSQLTWVVILAVVLSWSSPKSESAILLTHWVEPLLGPIRRVLPAFKGMDLSPMVLVLLIQVLAFLLPTLS